MALAGQFVGLTSLRSYKCYEYQQKRMRVQEIWRATTLRGMSCTIDYLPLVDENPAASGTHACRTRGTDAGGCAGDVVSLGRVEHSTSTAGLLVEAVCNFLKITPVHQLALADAEGDERIAS